MPIATVTSQQVATALFSQGGGGNSDPYPMRSSPWIPGIQNRGGNIPFDVPGNVSVPKAKVPFWDDPFATLDPSNSNIGPWDQIKIAGLIFPGLATVKAHCTKRVQLKKQQGVDYAKITNSGKDPAEIKVLIRIWTPEQLDYLVYCLNAIDRPFNVKADIASIAFQLYHPALAIRNITQGVVRAIGILERGPQMGVWQMAIDFVEYKKIKNGNNTGTVDGNGQTKLAINATAASFPPATVSPPSADTSVTAIPASFP